MGKVPALQDGEAILADSRPRSAPTSPSAIRRRSSRRRPAIPCAQNISTGCFSARAASSRAMVQVATKVEMNPVAAGWGDAQRVFDVLDAALTKGLVDSRREFLRSRYRDRVGAEFRGQAFQDGARAPLIRPLHRCLRGAAGLPARNRACGGLKLTPARLSGFRPWHGNDVVAEIDEMRLAGDAARQGGQQVQRRSTKLVQRHTTAKRRVPLLKGKHRARIANAGTCQRPNWACRNRIHANARADRNRQRGIAPTPRARPWQRPSRYSSASRASNRRTSA